MAQADRKDDEALGIRFLIWGAGLLVLPWVVLGVYVLFGAPWPDNDPEASASLQLVCLLAGSLISLCGLICLIASAVFFATAASARR